MRQINLISLTQAYKNVDDVVYRKLLKYLKINPKEHELDDLDKMVNELLTIEDEIDLYSDFYFGYSIPQIGKEFDLLKFGEESIINIELKRTSDGAKIQKQLLINKYYLKFLGLEI
ncbi:MAG: hypothetical protein EOO45_08070 [Flavobacterium sp.]|nr:MAG: hypothetical protein EOO45_08070 [Flavobacterium sp.]